MKKTEENKLSMYYAVRKVCDLNSAIWSGLPAFVLAYADFTVKIPLLEEAIEKQAIPITGHTKNKDAEEEAMVTKAVEVARAVYAYAEFMSDPVLQDKVDWSATKLKRARDTLTLQQCQLIKDEALVVVISLGGYGVMMGDLNQLQLLIDAFGDVIADPRAAIVDRKGATSDISQIEGEIDIILKKRMDPLMENFKAPSPDFYELYFDARIIVDRGVRLTVVEGVVKDAATGDVIAGALVELVGHAKSMETDAEGGYRFERIKVEGDNLRVSKEGWLSKELPVVVGRGKTTVVDVELDAEAATEVPEETE